MAGSTQAPGTDLVKLEDGFAIAKVEGNILDVLSENLGSGGLTVFDLDRIRIPAGGGRAWEVPSLDGPQVAQVVEGIIVQWREPRAYWATSLDDSGGGTPPDCASDDGVMGEGEPGGACARCPMASWGSSPKEGSRGQACKQMRLLFLLRPSDLLPLAVFLPPTSIAPIRKYFLRLASAGRPYYSLITKLALEVVPNAGGINYSRVVPEAGPALDASAIARVKSYSESIRATLDRVKLTDEDLRAAHDDV